MTGYRKAYMINDIEINEDLIFYGDYVWKAAMKLPKKFFA
jgi:hypothetical protein